MSKIAISFLGTGNYQPTCYELDGKLFETAFFPEALKHFFDGYELFVVMTKEAKEKHDKALQEKGLCYERVDIPSGKNEGEIWNIFEAIAEVIPDKSHVVMDVTHGFRSQPLLALAALIYLQNAKDIIVDRIVYGAFEAKHNKAETTPVEATPAEVTPVFDLTSFLRLIEWSSATQQYLTYGNALPLRNILNTIHKSTYQEQSKHKAKALKTLGNNLEALTQSLALVRPKDVLEHAPKVSKSIEDVQSDIENLPEAKPLSMLLEQIQERTSCYQAEELFSQEGLKAQLHMMQHYIEVEQYTQAITLARELLISHKCVVEGLDPKDKEGRHQAARKLNDLGHQVRKLNSKLTSQETEKANLWNELTDIRNDINHAGMRKNPLPYKKALTNIENICEKTEPYLKEIHPLLG